MATSGSWQRADAQLNGAAWDVDSTRTLELKGKRAFDLVLSVTGLVLGSPFMALGAAAVWIESRGCVFSRVRCWGRGARSFERLCLRTSDAEGRMTRAGRAIHRVGIDGLPQLVNVLRGEMSIVGPAAIAAEGLAENNIKHLRRFEMRPGMTGMWPLGGCRDVAGQYFSPDEAYGSSRSHWLDLTMVARKVWAVVEGRCY